MRIFCFNWHTIYTFMLAKTGHDFEVGAWIPQGDGAVGWNFQQRPVPDNIKLIDYPEEAKRRMAKGRYDLIICFTLQDLEFSKEFKIPIIFFSLNSLKTTGKNSADLIFTYREVVKNFLKRHKSIFVSVSELKYNDWKIPGLIIKSGIDPEEFSDYQGDSAKVLTVMNLIKERHLITDYPAFIKLTDKLPHSLRGINPDIIDAKPFADFSALKRGYQKNRLYLNITKAPFEDGYNLAMLEAMASGMPIVSIANPTSPLTNGKDGFISENLDYLREKIELLLEEQNLARKMGAEAKKTVQEKFSIKDFIANWNQAFSLVTL